MSDEVERELDVLLRTSATIRSTLDDLVQQIAQVDEHLDRLSSLRPDATLTLVSDSVLLQQQHQTACASCAVPAVTIGIRLPGGVGLVVWRDLRSSQNGDDLHSVGDEARPNFMTFADAPPILRRLLVPHLEGVLAGLRQRLGR